MVDIWEMAGILEIQDGGSQTGNNYISTCRLDSDEITTAKPMFSRSPNSTALLAIPHNVTGSGKSKMAAAAKLEITHTLVRRLRCG